MFDVFNREQRLDRKLTKQIKQIQVAEMRIVRIIEEKVQQWDRIRNITSIQQNGSQSEDGTQSLSKDCETQQP